MQFIVLNSCATLQIHQCFRQQLRISCKIDRIYKISLNCRILLLSAKKNCTLSCRSTEIRIVPFIYEQKMVQFRYSWSKLQKFFRIFTPKLEKLLQMGNTSLPAVCPHRMRINVMYCGMYEVTLIQLLRLLIYSKQFIFNPNIANDAISD